MRNFPARNSGPGNGCADFMGALDFLFLSAGKPHAHKIPRFFFRDGGEFLEGGGWKCQFYLYGSRDFSETMLDVSEGTVHFEAQQRYFSHRVMLVAVRCAAQWGITQICLCETKCHGGYRTVLGSC